MTVALLNHLLAHHLATNDAVPAAAEFVLSVLRTEKPIATCETEEGLGGPVLHRWNLRLASLVAPSIIPPIRAAGFDLIHATFASSTTSLLSQSKAILALALNIIGSPKTDSTLFIAAMRVVRLILGRSTWHAEWAREVVGAAVVQRTVQSLVTACNSDRSELKLACLETIVALLPLFPTPLRPLSPSLHTLSISLLCDPSRQQELIVAGSNLFVSLYLLAPKGKDGLKEAWKKGAEALVGSIDGLVMAVTSGIFAEDPLTNHTLSPLALPPLSYNSPINALSRMEALSQALCLLLRTPTSERAGPVEVPVGSIVELGVRLVGMSSDMPVKERTDPTTLTHTMTLLPRLQIVGAQILAQLALSVGPRLVAHGSEILGTVSRTLSTYPLRSPMRPALSTAYSIILTALGAAVDPEEGKKSLARVWRSVLEDIGSVAVEPLAAAPSEEKGRKNKRQKTYDPAESMDLAGRRVRLDEVDLAIAERGLATLERLLSAPHSHFLPPKLQVATSRLLLAITLDPAFFAAHSTSARFSSEFPATSASKGIDIAKQSDGFRQGSLKCLKAALDGAGGAEGLVDRAAEVWRRGSADTDQVIKSISTTSLKHFSALIHPALPPLQVNSTFARLRQERLGGPVGDEMSILEGANEFRSQEIVVPEAGSAMQVEGGETVDTASIQAEVNVQQATTSVNYGSTFSATTSSFGTTSSTLSAFDFAAPPPATVIPIPKPPQEEVMPFISEASTSIRDSAPRAAKEQGVDEMEDSDGEGDDEAMPVIVMDSDEDEE